MNKIKYFYVQTINLCKLLKIRKPQYITDNKKLRCYTACLVHLEHVYSKRLAYAIEFNANKIKALRKDEIIHVILHELGHFKTSGNTIEDKEYNAEKFALKIIEKYYKQYYDKTILELLNATLEDKGVYKKAFSRLLGDLQILDKD